MALRDLNSAEMTSVTANMIDPNIDRPLLETNPVLLAGLENVDEAHHALVSAQETVGTIEKQVRVQTKMITETDVLHDRKGRGLNYIVTGLLELADDPEEAASLEDILTSAFPLGLAIIRAGYREQAGQAIQVRARLTTKRRTFLERYQLGTRTLYDETIMWLDAAEHIGRLVDERAKLVGDEDDAVSRGDIQAARNAWMEAMRELITLLNVARVDADTRRRLLAGLYDAEKRAMARRKRSTGGVAPAEVPEVPETPETPEIAETPETPELV